MATTQVGNGRKYRGTNSNDRFVFDPTFHNSTITDFEISSDATQVKDTFDLTSLGITAANFRSRVALRIDEYTNKDNPNGFEKANFGVQKVISKFTMFVHDENGNRIGSTQVTMKDPARNLQSVDFGIPELESPYMHQAPFQELAWTQNELSNFGLYLTSNGQEPIGNAAIWKDASLVLVGGKKADSFAADARKVQKSQFYYGEAGNDTLSGGGANDRLFGGDGDDRLGGNRGDDQLYGGAGNDYLEGGNGNDTLEGGDGNDTIDGWGGRDKLAGGAGNDEIWAHSNSDDTGGDSVWGGTGDDKIYAYGHGSLLHGQDGNDTIEIRHAAVNGNHTIHAGNGNDTASGGSGNDTLYGGQGHDKLDGGAGHDRLEGGNGNDTIYGGDDNDTLYGGAGSNELTGGGGRDVFVFNTAPQTGQKTTIKDFWVEGVNGLPGDKIRLSKEIFKLGNSFDNDDFQSNNTSIAKTINAKIIFDKNGNGNGDGSKLYYDADGSGAAHQAVLVADFGTWKVNLTKNDIEYI
jgi:hypothetical protein